MQTYMTAFCWYVMPARKISTACLSIWVCDFISKVNHDRTMFLVVRVDFVLISEVNGQTVFSSSWLMWTMSLSTMLIMTRLNHTVLADQITPVRIIGSTLSKKIASNCFCYFTISFVYYIAFHLFKHSVANSWELVCGGLFGTSPDRRIE